jgi:hypothetical protein
MAKDLSTEQLDAVLVAVNGALRLIGEALHLLSRSCDSKDTRLARAETALASLKRLSWEMSPHQSGTASTIEAILNERPRA